MIDEPLAFVRLFDDSFFVVLADGAGQFVVVHRRSILPLAPQLGNADRIFDLENS